MKKPLTNRSKFRRSLVLDMIIIIIESLVIIKILRYLIAGVRTWLISILRLPILLWYKSSLTLLSKIILLTYDYLSNKSAISYQVFANLFKLLRNYYIIVLKIDSEI